MADCGGIAVPHKVFLAVEQEKLKSEEAPAEREELKSQEAPTVDEADLRVYKRQPQRGRLNGWQGVLIGTGVGIAIAVGGMRLLSRPAAQTPAVAPQQQQNRPPSMSVTVAPVETTRVARTLNTTGTVAARDLIAVLPQTTGLQIEQILVDEGDVVKAGQVMAVLDNSVLQAQLSQAKAEVESSQAVVRQRQAALAQGRASLAEAERIFKRNQQLANAGAISREDLDTRATAVATATEAVRVAEANISSAQADVRSSIARVQQLQTQLEQTVVRAPAGGIVAEKNVEIGNVTNGTQQLFSIIRGGLVELQAQVPAIQLPQVRIGVPALITSDTDPRVRLQGKVREIAPLVDPQSRQATVTIDIPSTSLLRPGMFARAAITTTTVPGLTIPAKAVVPQPDGSSIVFVLSNQDKVQAQPVEVGEVLIGGRVEILNGLKLGDRVAVAGAGYLKDGDRVQVVGARD